MTETIVRAVNYREREADNITTVPAHLFNDMAYKHISKMCIYFVFPACSKAISMYVVLPLSFKKNTTIVQ